MGRVFRASDTRLARIVALKVLPPEQAADAETVQRFRNEAQSAARLDHENIARVHYVGEDRGIHFIAFEFVEGVNIRVLVEQRGPLPLAEAASYTLQVAEALAHANARNVVHRDIKPSNVIITPEGRVKLIDMGLARLRQLDSAAADLTASGVTLGTFDYISPEQARDPRNADTRSDIYSLGCTFFFMLTGRPPFLEGTVLQKLLQHQTEPPPDVREFRPDLPEVVNFVLQKMLAKEPRDRYRNAGELAHDLLAIADRLGLQSLMPGNWPWPAPAESSPNSWLRHLPWMASIAALVAIVLALELYWKTTAPRLDTQNPPYALEEDFVHDLPPPALGSAPGMPVENSLRNESPSKILFAKNQERVLPAAVSPGNLASAGIPTRIGETMHRRSFLNADMSGEANVLPHLDSTAEPYLRGQILESPQPLAGPADIFPTNNAFPLDVLDFTTEPWRIPPPSAESALLNSAEPVGKVGQDAAPAEMPAKSNGVLVVCDVPDGDNEFDSLAAACAIARNGDIIELRFNGRRTEKPLQLPNLRLTIRAGKGFSPVVVFQPLESDPVKYPRGMFTLYSGRLSLTNLSLELIVPRDIPTESWSLFEVHGGQTLRIEHCTLTIDNAGAMGAAYHSDTAFFRALPASELDAAVSGVPSAPLPSASFELFDTLVRGEAVLLREEGLQPAQLSWENGLLITSENLLFASGGVKEPKPNEMLLLNLRHVTAMARNGLCRLSDTPAAPFQLPLEVNCADNIFIGISGIPLIRQDGVEMPDILRRQIAWNGDLNYYDAVDLFWSIGRANGETPPESMNFGKWLSYWGPSRENQPRLCRLDWKRLPGIDLPAHLQAPVDYALDPEQPENPALGAASDGYDAGAQIGRLPSP